MFHIHQTKSEQSSSSCTAFVFYYLCLTGTVIWHHPYFILVNKRGLPRETLKRTLTRETEMTDIKSLDEIEILAKNRDSWWDTASPVWYFAAQQGCKIFATASSAQCNLFFFLLCSIGWVSHRFDLCYYFFSNSHTMKVMFHNLSPFTFDIVCVSDAYFLSAYLIHLHLFSVLKQCLSHCCPVRYLFYLSHTTTTCAGLLSSAFAVPVKLIIYSITVCPICYIIL